MGETKYPRQIEKGFIPNRYKAFFSLSIKLFHITEYFIGRFVPTHRAALFARFWNNAYIQNRFVASKRFRYFKLIFNPTLVRITVRQIPHAGILSIDPNSRTLSGKLLIAASTQSYSMIIRSYFYTKRTLSGKFMNHSRNFHIIGIPLETRS